MQANTLSGRCLLVLCLLSISGCSANGATPRLAFVSTRDGHEEIYVATYDRVQRLTQSAGRSKEPAWSPDGRRIAFTSDRDGKPQIYVMDADGGNPSRLTGEPGMAREPSWSPDGAKLVFVSDREGQLNVYVMKADGADQTRLTHNDRLNLFPAWSPAGDLIAFVSAEQTSTVSLCLIAPSGTDERCPGPEATDVGRPMWSPDGTRIALVPMDDKEVSRVGVLNVITGQYTVLAGPMTSAPTWSPDGSKIAYLDFDSIYMMNPDGSDKKPIAELQSINATDWLGPVWSPDGKRIAFVSVRDRQEEIYIVEADGSQEKRVTSNDATDYYPVWAPR